MDLPIETISALVKNEVSAETVIDRQIQDLTAKQEMIQGSIELLTDLAAFTQFHRFIGDPYVGWLFTNPWLNRVAIVLWGAMWIAIPVIGIVDACLDGDGIRPRMIVFWVLWMLFFGGMFLQFRRTRAKR